MDIEQRRNIAAELLGQSLTEPWGGFARCPGEALHSGKNGAQDFRVILEGAPTGHCFHNSCSAAVDEFNAELRKRIWRAEHGNARHNGTYGDEDRNVAAVPKADDIKKRQPINQAAIEHVTKGVPAIDAAWLARRSPIDPKTATFEDFFSALYEPDERVLIFTRFTSQGDFLWWVGKGGFRLGEREGVKAVPSDLPRKARCGVWFLANPVDGKWHPSKYLEKGQRKLSRRAESAVTSFRYLVLESDELTPEVWLRVLVPLRLPIAAIYTSGGKSIHALVRVGADAKPEWDMVRNELSPLMTAVGADGAAMSAVRLTRLPFTLRMGSEKKDGTYVPWQVPGKQELLWLDPEPNGRAMINKPIRR
jgi:hypothetical protein